MRKVWLDVEQTCEGIVIFAYGCVGFETRRNLYVKIVTDKKTEKTYLKIRKKDTKISDSSCIVQFDVYRNIEVSCAIGLKDERLQILEDEQIIEKIDKVESWYCKILKKIIG